jgi:hypothetical protein
VAPSRPGRARLTEGQFRCGQAENRLARATDELRAIARQIDAMPPVSHAVLAPLQSGALELMEAAKALANAVIDAAHRIPRPEDT